MLHSIAIDGERTYIQNVDDRVGKLLRNLLVLKGLRKSDVIKRTGLSRSTIDRHFSGEIVPSVDDREKYARAFDVPFHVFEPMWQPPVTSITWMDDKEVNPPMEIGKLAPSGIRNIDPASEVEHFHGVDAARITNRAGVVRNKASAPPGAKQFYVTIDGDCMEPRYQDGDVVLFSVSAWEREGIVDGKDYFLQFDDDESTFKSVLFDPDNRELFILQPLNPKYAPRTAERSSIRLAARAIQKLVNV